jgi:hypothetical protein
MFIYILYTDIFIIRRCKNLCNSFICEHGTKFPQTLLSKYIEVCFDKLFLKLNTASR